MTPLLAQRPSTDRAFERLYRRHVADVYRYALAVLHNPSDAEDVTQTTFMNAYRAFQRGERPRTPQNWLIAIAHNVCRQRFRQSTRRPTEVAFDDTVSEAIVDDETPSVEDIRRALSHLAFNQRAALVMRELEGRSYAEIAELMDLSVAAVEALIFRARRALREQLEGGLTCGEAERAISKQLDGRLSRAEKGALRAHLRECKECATHARRHRAHRAALRGLGAIPVPASLSSFFGGGAAGGAMAGAAVGTGFAAKAAIVAAAGMVATGIGYQGVKNAPWREAAPERQAPSVETVPVVAPVRLGASEGAARHPSLLAPGRADHPNAGKKPNAGKRLGKKKKADKGQRGRALGKTARDRGRGAARGLPDGDKLPNLPRPAKPPRVDTPPNAPVKPPGLVKPKRVVRKFLAPTAS